MQKFKTTMRAAIGVTLASVTVSAPAWGFAPGREGEHGSRGLEVRSGSPVRDHRAVIHDVPEAARAAFDRFAAAHPGWTASFDRATNVLHRAYGPGIFVAGADQSPERAEAAARELLRAHLALLAPGAAEADFVRAANVTDGDVRTVSFLQTHRGLRVLGGQLSFRFKKDRLFVIASEALPRVNVETAGGRIEDAEAERLAGRWITEDFGGTTSLREISGPFVLPLVRASGNLGFVRVLKVELDVFSPRLRFEVYVDARTGEPIAREQTLRFANGTVAINSGVRYPGGSRQDFVAKRLNVTVGSQRGTTDVNGVIAWTGSTAVALRTSVTGPDVTVLNDAGSALAVDLQLAPGQTAVVNRAQVQFEDAQLTTFVHAGLAKDFARTLAPNMAYLRAQLEATVNIADTCNAFSDGTTINFFQGSTECENTGRLPDVIYHEFGHSFHAHSIVEGAGSFDTSLSEGVSDYFAAAITGDPGMGRGFFFSTQALRHIDPPGMEYRWPDDADGRDPHGTGQIIGSALWDLRKALIAKHGQEEGIRRTHAVFMGILARAADIPSTYVEALAANDDDGNVANGTPDFCEITQAFEPHGLTGSGSQSAGVSFPERIDRRVSLVQSGPSCAGFQVQSATLVWQRKDDPTQTGTIPMQIDPSSIFADLPAVPADTVLQYRVEVKLGSGLDVLLPTNRAAPFYEAYFGSVNPVYCNDFETHADGWTHQLLAGTARQGADDWTWGAPQGMSGSGDPSRAKSGTKVWGNDLGGGNNNGVYQRNKTNALDSPAIEVPAGSKLRLQYWRWLNIEDGQYDKATIFVNGQPVWQNLDTGANGQTHHEDTEWMFHDVDLSAFADAGQIQVRYQMQSDEGGEFGGWNLDDFCLVSVPQAPAESCGDGIVNGAEQCDDGNTAAGDGCSDTCTTEIPAEFCGDGIVNGAEQCDDGNAAAGDGCSDTCTTEIPAEFCGDGIVNGTEQCDDGNNLDGDGCDQACNLPPPVERCGDGIVQAGEACDEGTNNGLGACRSDCTANPPVENPPVENPPIENPPVENPPVTEKPGDDIKTLPETEGDCGCTATRTTGGAPALFFALLAFAFVRRRR